ncbi:hypothetical protein ACQP2Y_21855 [Actinoplanes sp. CA-051413]|uniref:hypothetical protein n=1 Tax=Actinoplanes sp. CA-051413 TaxID=3239899 RepID=UPI003D98DE97
MSLDLQPLAATGGWASPFEHIDPDGDILVPVPADEQPAWGWSEDDEYRTDEP